MPPHQNPIYRRSARNTGKPTRIEDADLWPAQATIVDALDRGLLAIGETRIGQLADHPGVRVYTRRCGPDDTRDHFYITPDGRLWIGWNFETKQNPGAAIREAIAQAGQPRQLTLEMLGLGAKP